MRIAIAGAFSTGKTTLIKELGKHLPDHKVITNTEREIAELLNFNFNNNTKEEKIKYQQWLIQGILNDANNKDFITDTPIQLIEGYCKDSNILKTVMKYYDKLYDIIFMLYPEFEIKDDGVRHTDKEFQRDVSIRIVSALRNTNIKHKYSLTGDLKERVEQALYYINKIKKGEEI